MAKDRTDFIVNTVKKKHVDVEVHERHMDQEPRHTCRGVEVNKALRSESTAFLFSGFGHEMAFNRQDPKYEHRTPFYAPPSGSGLATKLASIVTTSVTSTYTRISSGKWIQSFMSRCGP